MPSLIDSAFEALTTYDQGSSRAALLPIDEAVMRSLSYSDERPPLERRLVAVFTQGVSAAAREYVCAKLTLIGSALCVTALAALLDRPESATAARNVLEALPHPEAGQALRERLPQLEGEQKIGVIQSLGLRRDSDSVPALAALLLHPASEISGAAAAALGQIGSTAAAKALREFRPRAPVTMNLAVADACLVCAERLLTAGHRAEAQSLYRLLAHATQPKHVQFAANRGLTLIPAVR